MSSADNHIDDRELRAFAIGQLHGPRSDEIEQHLLQCDRCGQRIDALPLEDPLVQQLRDFGLSPPGHGQQAGFHSSQPSLIEKRKAALRDPGTTLGKYLLCEVLGQGGMGVVYKAHDPVIDRYVAVKLFDCEFRDDIEAAQRFLREIRAIGRLSHEHVVTIHEVGQTENQYFLVMEWLSAGSVGMHIRSNGPFDWKEATRIVAQSCKGLQAAHDPGIVHRDIKPDNLLMTNHGTIKVSDFGLARILNETSLTHADQIIGTPAYMSPEQCQGKVTDSRCDLYALGATFYTLLTGKRPFDYAIGSEQVFQAHCNDPIPDPRAISATIPMACTRIIHRAMAKQPEDRYQTCAEMLVDLDALLQPSKPASKRNRTKAIIYGVIVLVVVLLMIAETVFWSVDRSSKFLTNPKTTNKQPTVPPTKQQSDDVQRRVAGWVQSKGGGLRVTYDSRFSRIDGISSDEPLPNKDFLVSSIAFLKRDADHIRDEDLQRLQPLDFLVALYIPKANITDDGLRHLTNLPRLRTLDLSDTKITDKGIENLAGCRFFELRLRGTGLTDAGVDPLMAIKGLGILDVTDTNISPQGLARLREHFPKCKITPTLPNQ